MTDEQHGRPQPPRQPGGDNNGAKWLAGALVAVAVVGGGYLALKNAGLSAPTDVASNDMILAEPADAPLGVTPAPMPPLSPADTAAAPAEALAPAAAGESSATTAKAAPRRTTASTRAASTKTAAAEPVATEQVIGVALLENGDGVVDDTIVVTPSRRPVWVSTPSARRLSALYPTRALDRGREGEASVSCIVQDGGALDCAPVSESPANAGFGRAAVRVARAFKHAPQRADGTTAAGTPVNLRVVFRIEDQGRRG